MRLSHISTNRACAIGAPLGASNCQIKSLFFIRRYSTFILRDKHFIFIVTVPNIEGQHFVLKNLYGSDDADNALDFNQIGFDFRIQTIYIYR